MKIRGLYFSKGGNTRKLAGVVADRVDGLYPLRGCHRRQGDRLDDHPIGLYDFLRYGQRVV